MDSQTSGTTPCPTCGEQRTADHACAHTEPTPPEAGDSALTDTGRIQIPEALLNTGLFRAAWKPSSAQTPEPVESIFERVEAPQAGSHAAAAPAPAQAIAEELSAPLIPVAPTFGEVEESHAAVDTFLAPPVDDVEPTHVVTPEVPADPWAGLDLRLTPNTPATPVDPWASLEPAAVELLPEPEATTAPVLDAETDTADKFDTSSFAAPEAPAEPVNEPLFADPFAVGSAVAQPVKADEYSFEPAVHPEIEADEYSFEPAVHPEVEAPLSPIAAAAAAAPADALAAAPSDDAPVSATDEFAEIIDLDETAAIDMAAAMQTGPVDLEPVPVPEVSAFDLYGDSLYAPAQSETPSEALQTVDEFPAPATDAPSALPEVGLSAAGVTSASLPGSVPFAPGIGVDGSPEAPGADLEEEATPRRFRKGLAAGVAAAVLVAGGGGWFWWNSQKDAPVKDAFAVSHGGFTSAATQLRQATSIAEIAAAGAAFEGNLDEQRATDEKSRETNSSVAVAVRRASLAESAVAAAAAPLKDLKPADLSSWAETQDSLRESVEGLSAVREDIETAGGSADLLPSVEIVDQLQETIADEVVTGASDTVTDLSAKLEAATLLADVRAVGASAGEYTAPLAQAAEGITDPAKKDEMLAVVEFHEALSGFTALRPATLDVWDAALEKATDAAKELSEETRPAAEAGLKAVDETVKASRTAFGEWEEKNEKAKATKETDLANLATAVATATGATSTLTSLDSDLDDVLTDAAKKPVEGEESDVASRLADAASSRETLLSTLKALTVVPKASAELQALVDVVEADAKAVRAAADAAKSCTDSCVAGSKPAVKALTSRSTVADWNTALAAWEPQAEKITAAVKKRKLPERPKI